MENLAQETIGLLIGRARRLILERVLASAAPYGITPQQFWIVLMVLEGDDVASSDIAARMSIDKSTASRLIDKLVLQQWIKTTPSAHDKRRLRLQLTAKGLRQARELRQVAVWLNSEITSSIDPQHRAVVAASLRQVIGRLESLTAPPRKPRRVARK